MTVAERFENFLKRTFSKRKLCFIYFYYVEKGVDLKNPVLKMQPYLAWVHTNEHLKKVTPLFRAKIQKGRNLELKDVKIIPIDVVEVI